MNGYLVPMSTFVVEQDTLARAARGCAARIGETMPTWAPRKGARCEFPAVGTGVLRISGRLVELPLCQVHLRKLRKSPDPAALARSWSAKN